MIIMKLVGFYNYTVWLTYAGAAAAVCGIFFSAGGHPFWGVICLLFAGATDMFDGKIASTMKRNEAEKNFGIQIDSLCDLISFGVLPVAIGYGLGLSGGFFFVSAVLYIICAIIRLAYFNVDEIMRQKNENGSRKTYYGLPVTAAAMLFPLIYGLKDLLGAALLPVYQVALFAVAAAFILKFKIRKPRGAALWVIFALGLAVVALVITAGL